MSFFEDVACAPKRAMHAGPVDATVVPNAAIVLRCQLEARRIATVGNHSFKHWKIDRRRIATAARQRRHAARRAQLLNPALQRADSDAESLGDNGVGLAATLVCTNGSLAKLDRVGRRHGDL
jgi:hypothetical protein